MPENSIELRLASLEAARIDKVLRVVDESIASAREARERREEERVEREREAERRREGVAARLRTYEAEEAAAATDLIARLAGDAGEAADRVEQARVQQQRLLGELRQLRA